MNLRPLLALIPFLLLPAAVASTADAEKRLKVAVNDVLAIAKRSSSGKALAEGLRPVLGKYLSFEAMTRRAVGPGWRQFSPAQQKKATGLFTTLVIRTYSDKFTPGQDPVVEFGKAVTPAAGRVEVPTTVLYQGSRYSVVYRLEQTGGWRITDIVIEGVSLIANYRTQFDSQFKQGGADAVLSALTKSVATP